MKSALLRRVSPLLLLPAVLTACGIPATDVVEAGGPASGIEARVRVYFVVDDGLFGVYRGVDGRVDVRTAMDALLQGPTDREGVKGVTTELPSSVTLLPTAAPAAGGAVPVPVPVPTTVGTEGFVRVRTSDDAVQLSVSAELDGRKLAVAQLICTALEAQRIASPGTPPKPVSVTQPDGFRTEGADADCPAEG
ncbi:hypothetical protein ABZ027_01855 [Streptomyces sp. NPDC006332]|uniref:hypothetical protein n=1 Tax=Streptomyces sp. NPDC006332 TaxID=3155456 RepID=UPI0033B60806